MRSLQTHRLQERQKQQPAGAVRREKEASAVIKSHRFRFFDYAAGEGLVRSCRGARGRGFGGTCARCCCSGRRLLIRGERVADVRGGGHCSLGRRAEEHVV